HAGGGDRNRSGSAIEFRSVPTDAQPVRIDTRWGAGDPDRMRAYAKELIGTAPDVAVADSTPAALALHRESRTTPIIFVQAGNPVGSGLVANLVGPGGNRTVVPEYVPSMAGQWLVLVAVGG